MTQSGRWFKADAASAAWLKANKVKNVRSGVVRVKDVAGAQGNRGSILKHLNFEQAGLLSPAAPAALASILMQQSLESSLADIQAYLEVIDEKLEVLLQQRKHEMLGQLGGVSLVMDDAVTVLEETGHMSSVTWSKIQANSVILATIQAESIAQLQGVATRIADCAHDVNKLPDVLKKSREDAIFWVGVLARTVSLEDRQYVLELARVEEEKPEDVESHRRGIHLARERRHSKIFQALTAITESVQGFSNLSNRVKVANPFDAPKIVQYSNEMSAGIGEFLTHLGVGVVEIGQLERGSWAGALKGLVGETAEGVGAHGSRVAGQAKGISGKVRAHRDQAVLAKAERIRSRRSGSGKGADEAGD